MKFKKLNKLSSSLDSISDKFSFSKQNKEYEKYFSNNTYIKGKGKNNKSKLEYLLNPKIYNVKKDNYTNIFIKSNFNYVSELTSLNKFSTDILENSLNNNDIKKEKSINYSIIQPKLVDMEARKIRCRKIMKKFLINKLNKSSETIVAPGKYNPKYEYLKKRIPIAFLGKPKKIKYFKINQNKNLKKQTKLKSEQKNNKTNTPKTCKYTNNKINLYKKKLLMKSASLPVINEGEKSEKIKETENNNELKKFAEFLKNEVQLSKIFPKNNSRIKCPILFDKIQKRKTKIDKDTTEVLYTPNYNSIRPHIPSTFFKTRKTFQNFKRYITGKIIRSYCYTPDSYFILQVNKKEFQNDL